MTASNWGKIEIEKKFSFFEVEQGMEMAVLTALNGRSFNGKSVHAEITEFKARAEQHFVPQKKKGRRDAGRSGRGKKKHRKGRGKW